MRAVRTRAGVATMLAGTLLAAASPAVAHAESPRSTEPAPQKVAVSTARLVNLKSGKVLQAVSTANGAVAAQFPCDDAANQGWAMH